MSKSYSTKQVLVVRKDLKMRAGKTASQAGHSCLGVFTDMFKWSDDGLSCTIDFSDKRPILDWLDNSFAKICVFVNSEEELDALYNQALEAKIPCYLCIDNGTTEFHGQDTKTVLAIGPWESSMIDKLTGHLPLL